ncbi:MAG: hypothetical protein PVF75_08560 [Granulosicoccaceae bacterium]|jgi:hypothetical protein
MARHDDQLRRQIAVEAARLMAEHGVKDFLTAKKKAGAKFGVHTGNAMPKNTEIEAALIEHQRIFQGDSQQQHLRELREAALEALQFFAEFRPKLVGSVLRGTAGPHSDVNLHVFTHVENFVHFLKLHHIPVDQKQRRYRFGKDKESKYREKDIPVFQFMAGDVPFDVAVFEEKNERDVPMSKLDGKPEERASLSMLKILMEKE